MSATSLQRFFALLLIIGGLLLAPQSHAANPNVTCTTTGISNMAFGNVDPNSSQTDTTATISWSCNNTGGTGTGTVCFSITDGLTTRNMTLSSNNLAFQVFVDAARTVVWGNTATTNNAVTSGISFPAGITTGATTLYGRVTAGQTSAVPGSLYTYSFAGNVTQITYATKPGNGGAPTNCATPDTAAVNTSQAFQANATVVNTCTVSAPTLDFGSPTQLTSAQTGSTNLSITCANLLPYKVGLDAGLNGGGNVNNRAMKLGANTVSYQLYSDSGRTTVWGNTIGTNTVSGTGNGSAQTLTAYGLVPIQTTPPPGVYTDTITISVTY
jgi:spore coat protein U-like protein